MLRITLVELPQGALRLRLEGRLVGPWNVELRRVCAAGPVVLELDLNAVTFVDTEGVELLQHLVASGVRLVRVSPFVSTLLRLPHAVDW